MIASTDVKSLSAGRHLIRGTAGIFAAEALLVPAGIASAAFLGRRFGPAGYGVFTLANILVVLVQTNVAMAVSQPAIKLVSEVDDWRPVGTSVLRLYLTIGSALGLLLWIAAGSVAGLLKEPELAKYLSLLAIDIPLFCVVQAHRNIIVGRAWFRARAAISAVRCIARLTLIIVFVAITGSLTSAIWATICGSLVELIACRFYVRPSLSRRDGYPLSQLCSYAFPLVAAAICLSLFGRLDLIMLRAMGRTTVETGIYGVAQNMALLPSLLSFAFAPALLAILCRMLAAGDHAKAKEVGRQAIRVILLLAPLVAIAAGAATEIIELIFGNAFSSAGPVLSLLILSTLALLLLAVSGSIMTAAGRPKWTFHIAWPALGLAAVGHVCFIPGFGMIGAASVTAVLAFAGALISIGLVWRLWRIAPAARTLCSSAAISLSVYAFTALIPAPGALFFFKVCASAILALLGFILAGELGASEFRWLQVVLTRRPVAELTPAPELS